MKLELHHITPYADKAVFGTFNGVRDILTDIDFVNGIVSSLNNGSVELENFKLELRPLSDLTKEINLHDDFFAIPIENMTGYKLEGNINDAPTTVQHLYGCSKGKIEAKFLDYWVIVQLLEWHFDIHKLIENNLAIDINTLK